MSLEKEFADFFIDGIRNFEGVKVSIDELPRLVYEKMEANESVRYDRNKTDENILSRLWIKQSWDNISDFIQKDSEVKNHVNFEEVFTKPERFINQLAMYCIENTVSNCNFVREHSGETVTLSEDDVATIIRDLKEVK